MANSPSENPIVSPALGVAHHGAFHAAYLVQSLDALVLAVAQSAQLSLARLTMLAEPAYTGLHPFLGDGTPAASGVMIVEYSAASALAELRALATPAGIQAVTLSRGVEEDASFATLAARQALEAVSRFRAVLAAELVASLRCLRMQGRAPAALSAALAYLDERDGGVPDMHDRDLTSDLLLAEELVDALPAHVGPVQRRGADRWARLSGQYWNGRAFGRPETFPGRPGSDASLRLLERPAASSSGRPSAPARPRRRGRPRSRRPGARSSGLLELLHPPLGLAVGLGLGDQLRLRALGAGLVLDDQALELARGEVGLGEPLGHRRGELGVLGGAHAEQVAVGRGRRSAVGGVLAPRLEHLGPHHPQGRPRQGEREHGGEAEPEGRPGREGGQHGDRGHREQARPRR